MNNKKKTHHQLLCYSKEKNFNLFNEPMHTYYLVFTSAKIKHTEAYL